MSGYPSDRAVITAGIFLILAALYLLGHVVAAIL